MEGKLRQNCTLYPKGKKAIYYPQKYVAACCFIFLILSLFQKCQAEISRLTPPQIFEQMKEAYMNCRSYQDIGFIETTLERNGAKQVERFPFKIYYLRPHRFRFEWKAHFYPGGKIFFNIVWCDGNETFTYWETGKLDKMLTLEAGIKASAGVSRGGSYTVPSMLICPEKSTILTKLVDSVMIKEETVDDELCYLIQAKHTQTEEIVYLWIGKRDFLLRKLRRVLKLGLISEEYHHDIKINHDIPEKTFAFKPSRQVDLP